jgi:hypothetical protein
VTAILPHGIRALVNQFLAAEDISRSPKADERIRNLFGKAEAGGIIAYRRTELLQAALHRTADETPGHAGGAALDRGRTRAILVLTRLHFSAAELRVSSVQELSDLLAKYSAERDAARKTESRLTSNGRSIRAWRLRHLRPLFDLYPYAIRHGLARAMADLTPGVRSEDARRQSPAEVFSRLAMVNELALAHCSILRMRQAGRNRTRST